MEWNGLIGTGYDFHWGCLNIGPTATFQITHVELDSFTEDDSNIANLHFPDQDETSSRLTLGGKAEWDWHLGHTIVRPELRAAWLHEFDDTDYHIRWAFDNDIAGDDRHFCNVFGPNLGRDAPSLARAYHCSSPAVWRSTPIRRYVWRPFYEPFGERGHPFRILIA